MTATWWLRPTAAARFPGVDAARAWLQARGLGPGTRLVVCRPPSPALAALLVAAPAAGVELLLLNHRWPADALAACRRRWADLVWCEATTSTDQLPEVLPVDNSGDRVDLAGATAALVVATSGSSGTPKLVRLEWPALWRAVRVTVRALQLGPADRWFAPLALDHIGGALCCWRSCLTGHELGLLSAWDTAAAARALASATGTSLVPTMLGRLLDHDPTCLSTCRTVLVGGAALDPALETRARAAGIRVRCCYGMTETASQVCLQDPDDPPGSVGRPLPGWRLAIRNGVRDCAVGEVGEIVVAGPSLCSRIDEVEPPATGYATGDRGYRDDRGRLVVTGRADDRLVCGGENLSATAVAQRLCQHPAIGEALVVGLPDPQWGEVPGALLCGDEAADLAGWLDEHLPGLWRPRRWRWVEHLPHTPRGKPDRSAARRLLTGAEDSRVSATHTA